MDKIIEHVTTIVMDVSGISADDNIENDTEILTLGYVDSFKILEIINRIENAFNIKINDRLISVENMDSINRISSMIYKIQSGEI